ncbi:D-alanyl-D-alanine carboxypeptidase family protein [Alsobacter sp. SYSU BS001988]
MTRVTRCVSVVGVSAAAFLGWTAASLAAAPYVVADVNTGRVLFSEDATMPWYPASVTKLMTVYVTLKKMREGRISLDTAIPISKRATAVPPSKSGAKPGQEITLENAMKILLVKSANDMAVVIAEGVGGTVEDFAEMMNREAANLGMRESHFVNPNGLFAEGQQTSARDMAVLARALLLEFPEYSSFFNIGAVKLGNRVLKNTNGLVGRYPGIEGMKTGFICPSGFNLVAVASRNGQRLVAVVMGASSGTDRTLKAAQFLDKGFSGSYGGLLGVGGGTLQSLPASSVATPPNMREDICVHRKGAPASEDEAEPQTSVSLPGGNDDSRTAPLAAAAVSTPSSVSGSGPRSLGPRMAFDPVPVYFGRSEKSASAPAAANAAITPVMVARKPVEKAPRTAGAKAGAPKTATAYTGETGDAPASPIKTNPANVAPLKASAATSIGHGAKGRDAVKHGAIQRRAPQTAARAEPKAADLNDQAEPSKALTTQGKAATAPMPQSAATLKVHIRGKRTGAKAEASSARKTATFEPGNRGAVGGTAAKPPAKPHVKAASTKPKKAATPD